MVRVRLNGEERTFPEGATVTAILEGLGRSPRWVAVEVNRQVVPRPSYDTTALREGDVIEVVQLVGGG